MHARCNIDPTLPIISSHLNSNHQFIIYLRYGVTKDHIWFHNALSSGQSQNFDVTIKKGACRWTMKKNFTKN